MRACADRNCALWVWRLPDATPHPTEDASPPRAAAVEDITQEDAAMRQQESALLRQQESALLRQQERVRLRRAALRAIRGQCLACAGDRKDVRACAARQCPLWSLRFGVLPETYKTVRTRFFAPRRLTLFA